MKSGKCWVSLFHLLRELQLFLLHEYMCIHYNYIIHYYMYIHTIWRYTWFLTLLITSTWWSPWSTLKKTCDASTGRLRPQKHWLTVGVRFPMGEEWPCHARSSHNHGFSGKLAPWFKRKLVSWRYPKFILNHAWGRKSNEAIFKKPLDEHGP